MSITPCQRNGYNVCNSLGRDGGQVVSVLAFYSDDPSSNPSRRSLSFLSNKFVWKETKIGKKWPIFYNANAVKLDSIFQSLRSTPSCPADIESCSSPQLLKKSAARNFEAITQPPIFTLGTFRYDLPKALAANLKRRTIDCHFENIEKFQFISDTLHSTAILQWPATSPENIHLLFKG